MAKFAELPGGKILKFKDDATEKEMQRAVRRELGLQNEDVLETFERLVGQVETLLATITAQDAKHRAAMSEVADAFSANVSRMSAELVTAIDNSAKTHGKVAADLLKAMNAQIALVTKLNVTGDGLNRTMDAALGQSLASMDQAVRTTQEAATIIERGSAAFAEAARQIAEATVAQIKAAAITKRAYRNRDGSWTMEPDANRDMAGLLARVRNLI
jgi:hypothetical protein